MSGESFCIIDTREIILIQQNNYTNRFFSKPDFVSYYMLYPKYVIFSNCQRPDYRIDKDQFVFTYAELFY